MKTYTYHVTWQAQLPGGICSGRAIVTRTTPLTTIAAVEALESHLLTGVRRDGQQQATALFLTFWAHLSDENIQP